MLTESALLRTKERHEAKRAQRRHGLWLHKLAGSPETLSNEHLDPPASKPVLTIRVKPNGERPIGKMGRWASRLLGGGR